MCLLYCACYAKFIFADPLQKPHACQRFLKLLRNRHVLVTFGRVHSPLRLPHIATQNDASTSKMAVACFVHVDFETRFPPQRRALFRYSTSKSARTWFVLRILTSKCASRYNGVRLFDSSTSKGCLRPTAFTLSTSTCASARHRRALFDISTSKSVSKAPLPPL